MSRRALVVVLLAALGAGGCGATTTSTTSHTTYVAPAAPAVDLINHDDGWTAFGDGYVSYGMVVYNPSEQEVQATLTATAYDEDGVELGSRTLDVGTMPVGKDDTAVGMVIPIAPGDYKRVDRVTGELNETKTLPPGRRDVGIELVSLRVRAARDGTGDEVAVRLRNTGGLTLPRGGLATMVYKDEEGAVIGGDVGRLDSVAAAGQETGITWEGDRPNETEDVLIHVDPPRAVAPPGAG